MKDFLTVLGNNWICESTHQPCLPFASIVQFVWRGVNVQLSADVKQKSELWGSLNVYVNAKRTRDRSKSRKPAVQAPM